MSHWFILFNVYLVLQCQFPICKLSFERCFERSWSHICKFISCIYTSLICCPSGFSELHRIRYVYIQSRAWGLIAPSILEGRAFSRHLIVETGSKPAVMLLLHRSGSWVTTGPLVVLLCLWNRKAACVVSSKGQAWEVMQLIRYILWSWCGNRSTFIFYFQKLPIKSSMKLHSLHILKQSQRKSTINNINHFPTGHMGFSWLIMQGIPALPDAHRLREMPAPLPSPPPFIASSNPWNTVESNTLLIRMSRMHFPSLRSGLNHTTPNICNFEHSGEFEPRLSCIFENKQH